MAKTIAKLIAQDINRWGIEDYIELKSQLDEVINDTGADRTPREIAKVVTSKTSKS